MAVTTWMILRRSSNLEEFVNTFTEAVLPLGNTLRAISEGSLCFTIQAETTLALEALWKTYQDGTLQRNLQQLLITEEIKQLEDSEVMLTVEMDEQEYNNAVRDLTTTETQGKSSYNHLIFSLTRQKSFQCIFVNLTLAQIQSQYPLLSALRIVARTKSSFNFLLKSNVNDEKETKF